MELEQYLENKALEAVESAEAEFASADKPVFVSDMNTADRYTFVICMLQDRIKERNGVAKLRMDEIKAWKDSHNESDQRSIDNLKFRLRPYVEQLLKGSKKKTYTFSTGKASFRSVDPVVTVSKDELIEFVKKNCPEAYTRKEELVVTEDIDYDMLKKIYTLTEAGDLVTEDGEIVPGYSEVAKEDNFNFATTKGKK